ncbi:MAG: hypothetical protein GXO57_01865 [Thermodesulfobacteria bacterium]|nr:hypothetical protein [Thermodesulfobacteriota bacterium]
MKKFLSFLTAALLLLSLGCLRAQTNAFNANSTFTTGLANTNSTEQVGNFTNLNPGVKDETFMLKNLLVNAEVARSKGDCLKATYFYRSFLREKGDAPGVWNNYGVCLYQLGKFEEALVAFKMAYLQKKDPEYLFNQALCLLRLGDEKKACKIFFKLKDSLRFFVPNFLEIIDYCKSQVKIETKKTEVKRGKRVKENEQAVNEVKKQK